MQYTLQLNGESLPVLFILTEDDGIIRYVPNDPRNGDYQRIREDYESLEVKPFEFNFQ